MVLHERLYKAIPLPPFNFYLLPFTLNRFYQEQWLVVLNRGGIICQHLHDAAAHLALDLVEKLHGLDDAEHLAFLHLIAYVYKRRLIGRGAAVEGTDHRRLDGGAGCAARIGGGRSGRGSGSLWSSLLNGRLLYGRSLHLLRHHLRHGLRLERYKLRFSLHLLDGDLKLAILYAQFADVRFIDRLDQLLYLLVFHDWCFGK